jgi:hypothetical protein
MKIQRSDRKRLVILFLSLMVILGLSGFDGVGVSTTSSIAQTSLSGDALRTSAVVIPHPRVAPSYRA